MASDIKGIDLDKVGMTTSLLCAVHCLALPFLLSAGLISGVSWINHHLLEWCLIVLAILIAGKSFIHSYRHKHRSTLPMTMAAIAFVFLLTSRMIADEFAGHFLTAVGGVILAVGHYVNWLKLRAGAI